jgi:hypothetical protein
MITNALLCVAKLQQLRSLWYLLSPSLFSRLDFWSLSFSVLVRVLHDRGGESSMDISADLTELSKSPVAVVCAGAKSVRKTTFV